MDTNTNNINQNEPMVDETELIDETDDIETAEAIEAEERPRRRGRGRRPFGHNRPYRFALFVEEDGSFVLRSPDLAERSATIGSLDELGATMRNAIDERAAEDAAAQAEAEKDEQFSGKFVLRLPRSMHRQLTELAAAEGVSLNQLALGFLAEGLGRSEMIREFGERRGKHRGPRGGRGPEGRGPGGRGPWGRGPRGGHGHGPGERDHEGGGPGKRGGLHGFDSESRGHGSRHGFGPERRGGRWPRWFEERASSDAPDAPEQNEASFV